MQSPKFPMKVKDLREVVNSARLKIVWKSKVREAMRRQPAPDPIENLDFHTNISSICAAIETEVCNGAYTPSPPSRLLLEKSKGLCRQLVIPTVKDAIVLQVLSDELWKELKKQAPTANAYYAPNDQMFSKGIAGHSHEYDSVLAWLEFQKAIFGFTESKEFIVVTDIANYYDTISYDHLRNIVADKTAAREHALDLLVYSLSSMLWQPDYMPRVPVGLPQIALDAPRLLAHCFLFEIDDLLVNQHKKQYVRYMDDMDVGVNSVSEAKAVLRDLDLALQTRQVRLNGGKTKILSKNEAINHFKIGENQVLDDCSDLIDAALKFGWPLEWAQSLVRQQYYKWKREKVFETGNGQKILKRLINLSRKSGLNIRSEQLRFILSHYPGLREVTLAWWRDSAHPSRQLSVFSELASSGAFVDDAFILSICTSLVSARLPRSKFVDENLMKIAAALDEKNHWGLYSKLWLFSKYRPSTDIIRLVQRTTTLWSSSPLLCRLVAGMYPRLVSREDDVKKLIGLIRRHGSGSGRPVIEFHQNLHMGTHGYTAVKNFVNALNPSLPNATSHAKFLMLLVINANLDLAPNVVDSLKKKHSIAMSDSYYKFVTKGF